MSAGQTPTTPISKLFCFSSLHARMCGMNMSPLEKIWRLKCPICLHIKTLSLHIPLAEYPIWFSSGSWKYRTVTTWMQKALQRRLRFLQNLRQNPRKRIRQEYFGLLVHRGKLRGSYREVKLGKIVIVGSDNTNRLLWPLAQVLGLRESYDLWGWKRLWGNTPGLFRGCIFGSQKWIIIKHRGTLKIDPAIFFCPWWNFLIIWLVQLSTNMTGKTSKASAALWHVKGVEHVCHPQGGKVLRTAVSNFRFLLLVTLESLKWGQSGNQDGACEDGTRTMAWSGAFLWVSSKSD